MCIKNTNGIVPTKIPVTTSSVKLNHSTMKKISSPISSSPAVDPTNSSSTPDSQSRDVSSKTIIETITKQDSFTYGPNTKTMAHILENSELSLRITASQRLLSVPPEDRPSSAEANPECKLCCMGIPQEIFEDEIAELVNYDSEILELELLMDPMTETSRGIALITFVKKEYAEKAQTKLNDFEIRPGRKLKVHFGIPEFSRLTEFTSKEYDEHKCSESSPSKYCTCIEQMLKQIISLREEIKEAERMASLSRVDEAQRRNKMQYSSHSLRMEQIEPDAESLKKIINASDYAVEIINDITLKNIVDMHSKICPELKKAKKHMFRQEDVYINGIYNIPAYPSGPESIEEEMKDLVEYLHSLKTENEENAVIMAATAKLRFLLTHPFVDGNGRCSRVLFGAVLHRRNFPWITIPVEDSTRYYEALKMVQETEDLTLFYRFMCRCILKSLISYLESLRS